MDLHTMTILKNQVVIMRALYLISRDDVSLIEQIEETTRILKEHEWRMPDEGNSQ